MTTKEQFEEAMRNLTDIAYTDIYTAFRSCRPCAAIRAYVEELKAERRWISVEKRLPEEGQIIAVLQDGCFYMACFGSGRFKEQQTGCGCCCDFLHDLVTHWMPLPEPPKEED